MPRLTIFQTNDLHGRLTLEMAEQLDALTAKHQPSLLLDSGDAVACGNLGWHGGGEPIHHLMNLAGYDAGTLGNREFHLWGGPQAAKLSAAEFPIVCANLTGRGVFGQIAPAVELEPFAGLKVRVFGLLRDMVGGPPASWLSGARFRPPLEAAQEQVAARGDAAVCVCLSHLGLAADRELASIDGLDLVLGGHSHTLVDPPEQVSGTWIGQNAPYGGTLSRYELDVEDGRLARITGCVQDWQQIG